MRFTILVLATLISLSGCGTQRKVDQSETGSPDGGKASSPPPISTRQVSPQGTNKTKAQTPDKTDKRPDAGPPKEAKIEVREWYATAGGLPDRDLTAGYI